MVGGDWEDTIYFAIITIHCLFLVTSSLVLLSYLVKSIDYVRVLRNPRPIGKAYFGNRQTNERSLYRCLFDKVSFTKSFKVFKTVHSYATQFLSLEEQKVSIFRSNSLFKFCCSWLHNNQEWNSLTHFPWYRYSRAQNKKAWIIDTFTRNFSFRFYKILPHLK